MESKSIVRGCGTRVKGGAYIEIPLSDRGVPLDTFLVCPPQQIDPDDMRLSPRGVALIERNGITHVVDWIGSEHYPNVADVIAEARRHGISRRVSRELPFDRLSPQSRLLLVHKRAHLLNADELRRALEHESQDRVEDGHRGGIVQASCPQGKTEHMSIFTEPVLTPAAFAAGANYNPAMCQSLYWDDIEGGETVLDPDVPWRTVERTVGDTTYRARRRPDWFVPQYATAIFASFPIGRIAVIDDPDAPEQVQETLRRAREARGIDVTREEE